MGDLPTVSIVTPSFNHGPYIGRTIRSVLEQDYPSIEHVVMDAGSTDETVDVLRQFAADHPDRFQFVSEKDRGQSHALNKGVARTSGPIVGWLNSDDTYAPGAVSAAVDFLRGNPDVDLVYGDANFIDAADNFIARCAHVEPFNFHRLVHYTDFIVQPASFFTRRAFDAVGGADESLHFTMDYDLFLKMGSRFKVAYLPKVLANFRWLGANKSATGGHTRLDELVRLTRPFGANGLPAYMRIEAAFLDLRESWAAARKVRLGLAAQRLASGAGRVLGSPRALRSLVSPACWRVMWTGQLLRRAYRSAGRF